jgi:hypothetical protein
MIKSFSILKPKFLSILKLSSKIFEILATKLVTKYPKSRKHSKIILTSSSKPQCFSNNTQRLKKGQVRLVRSITSDCCTMSPTSSSFHHWSLSGKLIMPWNLLHEKHTCIQNKMQNQTPNSYQNQPLYYYKTNCITPCFPDIK